MPIVQNEANSGQPGRHPRADYAKRTQFGRAGRPARHPTIQNRRRLYKQTQFPAGPGGTRPGRRGRTCKTKPISRTGMRGPARGRGRCLRRSQSCKTNPIWPGPGRTRSPVCERCKTNPIARKRTGKTIAKAGSLDDATHQGGSRAKQSQFPLCRRNGMPLFALFSLRQVVGCARHTRIRPMGQRWCAMHTLPATPDATVGQNEWPNRRTATRAFLYSWLELIDYEK